MKLALKLALLGLPLALAACSALEGEKVDYKGAAKAPDLSIPPDLTQLPQDNRYALPGSTVSAANYQGSQGATQASGAAAVAVSTLPGLRIERASGSQRWLVTDQPADQLWPVVKEFWQELGFAFAVEQAQLGIMETEWAENRAKLPKSALGETLAKLLGRVYSTGQMDRYRTRLERSASGGTEIFISHRGVEEVFKDDDRVKTVWQARPGEPELEVEMLRRLMVKLGAPAQQAGLAVAATPPKPTSRLDTRDGQAVVVVDDAFDRAWRRVGLSLDRTGFTVEDRDRSQGTYFVRYVEPQPPGAQEPGFFSKLFSSTPKDKVPLKYRVMVRGLGDSSVVSVLNAEGAPETSENAQRILKVIADDLR